MEKAKERGADVVKQWDAPLDGNTRKNHVAVDGEIREIDKPFSNGLKYPRDPSGDAAEVVNCRCALLQRARWVLDESELDVLKQRAEYFGLDKSKDFEEFKTKYLKVADSRNRIDVDKAIDLGGLKGYPKTHHQALTDYIENAPPQIKKVWNDSANDFHILTPKQTEKKGTFYLPRLDGVQLSIRSAKKGSTIETPYQVVFHEFGHPVDYILNRKYGTGDRLKAYSETYKGGLLGKTVKREAEKAIMDYAISNGLQNELRYVIEKSFCGYMKRNIPLLSRADISDMFEPVMQTVDYPFDVGHGKNYWTRRDNGKEAFAEMFSAQITNTESWNNINRFFPDSIIVSQEFLKVVK